MTAPRARSPIAMSIETRARRSARREHVPMAQARANVARSIAMRTYWTRAKSYADARKIPLSKVRSSAGFQRNERIIKESTVRDGATEKQQRAMAEKLMRALKRQGLNIGKGKTWRDYVRKVRGGGELEAAS